MKTPAYSNGRSRATYALLVRLSPSHIRAWSIAADEPRGKRFTLDDGRRAPVSSSSFGEGARISHQERHPRWV
jgi:hypothetical protein